MLRSILFVSALLISGAGTAHEVPSPPDADFLDWRLIDAGPELSLFIGDIKRVGQAASFLAMAVYPKPATAGGQRHDAVTQPGLVDCASKRFEIEPGMRALNGMALPPGILRAPPPGADAQAFDDRSPPPADSSVFALLQTACGERPLTSEAIEDPYRWARQRYGVRTPPTR